MVSDERTDHYTPVAKENETDYGEKERAKEMKTASFILHLLAGGIMFISCIAETTDILEVIMAVFFELSAIYLKID